MAPKTILITGASSGIGAALARVHAQAYAKFGVTLLLWGRDEARLNETAQQCRALGATALIQSFDLRDAAGFLALLSAADARTPIDLAIFNAGLGGSVAKDVFAEAPESAQAIAEVNFVAPVAGASALAGSMAKRGRGQIVLVGSISESYPLPMAPTYAASKAGLRLFAEALGLRMKKFGVAVTLVSPGFIDTPMSRKVTEPKPFLMDADTAARIIARDVALGARVIVVPWQFRVMRAFTDLLPRAMVRWVMSRV
ncbi:MAG TPA: SDR family NAD(P)-dependent oxidoreductase [Rhizomicrobium sp.]|jgi:short-subunit dehydrogenase|nr:SDR family NAD(P)-dependent oxidoreductase [Rhizomicrobium sp.]